MNHVANRFEALDSLRGVAALVVALAHFSANTPLSTEAFIRYSGICVDFFFVLSGMVICWNYQHKLRTWRSAAAFALLRIGRVYPLHLATLCAMVLPISVQYFRYPLLFTHAAFGPYSSVGAFFSNLVMLQSLNVHGNATWNQPSWSVAVELWVYFAFAVLCLLRWTRTWVFVALVPLCTAVLVASPNGMGSIHDFGLFRCLTGFATGVICCRLYTRMSGFGGTGKELAALAAVAMVPVAGQFGYLSFLSPLVLGPSVLIFASEAGLLSRWLRSAALQYLGRISYSIYMNHFLIGMCFWVATAYLHNRQGFDLWATGGQSYGNTQWQGWIFVLAYLGAVLLVSHWTYRLIEMPGRQWSRRIAQRVAAGGL